MMHLCTCDVLSLFICFFIIIILFQNVIFYVNKLKIFKTARTHPQIHRSYIVIMKDAFSYYILEIKRKKFCMKQHAGYFNFHYHTCAKGQGNIHLMSKSSDLTNLLLHKIETFLPNEWTQFSQWVNLDTVRDCLHAAVKFNRNSKNNSVSFYS